MIPSHVTLSVLELRELLDRNTPSALDLKDRLDAAVGRLTVDEYREMFRRGMLHERRWRGEF